MPRVKRKSLEVEYVRGFSKPSDTECEKAVGRYPWYPNNDFSRRRCREDFLISRGGASSLSSVRDIDCSRLYRNSDAAGCRVWPNLPDPFDEGSWLANVLEMGQTVDAYISQMTLRSGNFKPTVNAQCKHIYIVPIVADSDTALEWPVTAPPLEILCAWVSAFFDRNCIVADYVSLKPKASAIIWRGPDGIEHSLRGRVSAQTDTGKFQTHVGSLLDQLKKIKQGGKIGMTILDSAFAVIGVTMTDLFSGEDDLFIAGMASASEGTAVLSYARYHPRLKMCSFHWDDFGYINKSSNYSYYEDNSRRPKVVNDIVPYEKLDKTSQSEFMRRAGKLFVHELCHVYGIAHCIHHHCLMNGTGHLVEDFMSPTHLCGICLRKLQFRLGFDVRLRYHKLGAVYAVAGMGPEVKWTTKRVSDLSVVDKNAVVIDDDTDT